MSSVCRDNLKTAREIYDIAKIENGDDFFEQLLSLLTKYKQNIYEEVYNISKQEEL